MEIKPQGESPPNRRRRWPFRPGLLAGLAVLAVLATEQLIEYYLRASEHEQERLAVLDSLAAARSRLEGTVNANLLMVQGLTAVIAAQPHIDQTGFARVARGMVSEQHALRNIAGAPDMIIRLMYPLDGNEAALGLDYRTHPVQRAAAIQARDSGRPVLVGPLNLAQGGQGIILREPVFIHGERQGETPRFWGLVSAVFETDKLLRLAGIDELGASMRIAIRGLDEHGQPGILIHGDEQLFDSGAVVRDVSLPGGKWQMAALPKLGWGQGGQTLWLTRLFGVLAAIMAGGLAFANARGTHALASSESRYRQLFEQSPLPMLVYALSDFRLLAVNEAFLKHYGYSRAETLALHLPDLYPEDEKTTVVEMARKLRGLAYVGEWHHVTKDGRIIDIEARSHDFLYEGQHARVAVITDITERTHSERALRDSEARHRLLIELAPFPAVISRLRDGVLLYVNRRAETQFRIGRQDGTGQLASQYYQDPAQRDEFVARLGQYGRVDDFETRMRAADGRMFWALITASIIEFDREPAIFASVNDITARKSAELALREQEEFFRLIAENIGDMVTVLDRNGRRMYASPSYRALYGDDEPMIGEDSFQRIYPDDQPAVRAAFESTVRTGEGGRIGFRVVQPEGGVRVMEAQGGVIRSATGRVERVIVVSRDVTERKRLEDEVRALNASLEQRVQQRTAELAAANKELETFTYSVSHDLKAPLRGIDGYSRLLLEDYGDRLDDEGRLFLRNVRGGVEQMSQLIEDLLAYSRMERRDMNGQCLDLRREVARVLAERKEDIENRGMHVRLDLPDLTVLADAEGLALVLRNLLDNALKFTRDSQPPTLAITAEMTEKAVIITFSDNGIGFDMQFHDRIFEIFQRLQRAEDYPGTGIGLAIAHKAMQRMGGRIRAESAPGRGATFLLELPR